jgi:hypothetical protein
MTIAALPLSDVDRSMLAYKAVLSVSCPKCKARPGQRCQSTGGGNPADVPTHRARAARIAAWSDEQLVDFAALVRAQGSTWWTHLPDDHYAASEAAAAPALAKAAKQPTPKGVRLSETQAERIEHTVEAGDKTWTSTTHLSGDAAERQTVQSLVAKGILTEGVPCGESNGERVHRLTPFGWQVYRQHRLIIRRLSAEEIDAGEAAATASQRCKAGTGRGPEHVEEISDR